VIKMPRMYFMPFDLNYKYPRGFKKKLIEFWGGNRCIICHSKQRVSIHHHYDLTEKPNKRDTYQYQLRDVFKNKPNTKEEALKLVNWDELWRFPLLCASCHSKIHAMMNFGSRNPMPPMLELLHKLVNEKKGDKDAR